ncbi:MAG: hypothetical protein H6Q42_67 [Deltaproteobacteria bacterium]|nr:hypothetical protein [Deltaproteobacteria bacterium]
MAHVLLYLKVYIAEHPRTVTTEDIQTVKGFKTSCFAGRPCNGCLNEDCLSLHLVRVKPEPWRRTTNKDPPES